MALKTTICIMMMAVMVSHWPAGPICYITYDCIYVHMYIRRYTVDHLSCIGVYTVGGIYV